MSPLQRLSKILSETGAASRRQAESLIREGRVTVNGRVAQIGDKADPVQHHIKVDGRRVVPSSGKYYLLLNKPKGTVTTAEDPQGRTTVLDLIKAPPTRLFPVGRLDYDAEGFLLLTNDGELAHRLTHPSFRTPRTYQVKIKGQPGPAEIGSLSRGIFLEDGRTAPCRITVLRGTEDNLWLEMVLYEGRNRQVKRMWQKLGYPVLKLKRVAFAGLSMGRLRPGEYRNLRPGEVQKLKELVAKKLPGEPPGERSGTRNPGNRKEVGS
ncbi:MAG: pseudouridine synthase [Pseudomonadota bacterium]